MNMEMKKQYLNIFNTMLYIETNYDTYISQYLLAEMADMKLNKYTKVFKQLYGVTPKQYVLQCRLRNVCNYLIMTDYSVNKIAMLCGFDDISYFYKSFKNVYDMTPTTFRTGQIGNDMIKYKKGR